MPIQDEMLGRQVRDLKITEVIGRGGMGAVYKAEHLLLREPRAVKVIRAESFRFPFAVERFQREARIAVKLKHPNLVLIHDFFVEQGDYFLVMEYLTGENLAKRIRGGGALSAEETCRIAIQCCAGLAHAHDMGIVHRDLSPDNILLVPVFGGGVQAKIIDFGIARAAGSSSGSEEPEAEFTLTMTGEFLGKPKYSSPEQAGGLRRGEKIDHRSDIYSLGLILYEMVTGDLPFYSETPLGYLALHLSREPARPSDLKPAMWIPPVLEGVILRCLEKDREARFQSCHELSAALAQVLEPHDQSGMTLAAIPLPAHNLDPEINKQASEGTVALPHAPAAPAPLQSARDAVEGSVELAIAPPPAAASRGRGHGLLWAGLAVLVLTAGGITGYATLWKGRDGTKTAGGPVGTAAPTATATTSPRPAAARTVPATPAFTAAPATPAEIRATAAPVVPSATPVAIPSPPFVPAVPPLPSPQPVAHAPAPITASPPPAFLPVRPATPGPTPLAALRPSPTARPRTQAPPALPPFRDAEAMQEGFEEAQAFEASHPPDQALVEWQAFIDRVPKNPCPSPELLEKARLRKTQLNLGEMRTFAP